MFFGSRYKKFLKWCKSNETSDNKVTHASTQQGLPDSIQFNTVVNNINESINNGDTVVISIGHTIPKGSYVFKSLNKPTCNIDQLILSGVSNGSTFLLENLRIKNLSLQGNDSYQVMIKNCDINNFDLRQNAKATLNNSKVCLVNFTSVEYLSVNNGCFLDFLCPVPGASNPFSGSISFNKTFIPRNTIDYPLSGPQPYRNIRHHLKSIENGQLANFFHSAELAVERESDTLFNKLISYTYETFSDFGASALRPAIWWFSIGLASALRIHYVKGAVIAFSSDSEKYSGWRSILIYDEMYRSVYLSFQTMLNPLGVLGVKSLVVPTNGWLVTWLLFQGLLSAVLIALMIFAIRRRFKISS